MRWLDDWPFPVCCAAAGQCARWDGATGSASDRFLAETIAAVGPTNGVPRGHKFPLGYVVSLGLGPGARADSGTVRAVLLTEPRHAVRTRPLPAPHGAFAVRCRNWTHADTAGLHEKEIGAARRRRPGNSGGRSSIDRSVMGAARAGTGRTATAPGRCCCIHCKAHRTYTR